MQVKNTCKSKCIIHKKYRVLFNYTIIFGADNKMFEIKKPTSSNKTIRMPDDLIDKMEKLAAHYDISFNQLVVQCCEYALGNMKKENE